MSKQYYAYIPFRPDKNSAELMAGVERWRSNVAEVSNANNFKLRLISALETALNGADIEKSERREKETNVARLRSELVPGPTLRKAPVLLKHGDKRPLEVLEGVDPGKYVLYVVGHCAPGSKELRNTQSHSTVTDPLEAKELLARMAADGLPNTILNLKLLACYGGSPSPIHDDQKAFADGFWRVLRGYCQSLVKLTAYKEPVLMSSFYANSPHKTYAEMRLGDVFSGSAKVGGTLGSVKKEYVARPCMMCRRPALVRCTVCRCEFCGSSCLDGHLDSGRQCPLGVD